MWRGGTPHNRAVEPASAEGGEIEAEEKEELNGIEHDAHDVVVIDAAWRCVLVAVPVSPVSPPRRFRVRCRPPPRRVGTKANGKA